MTFFSKRKRKNDDPPPFPAWIIVLIAIGLVIVVALFFQPATSRQSAAVRQPQGNVELTATYIIQQATASAQGTSLPSNTLSSLDMTGTYGKVFLTATALGTMVSGMGFDPILMTATAIVQEATNIARAQRSPPNRAPMS